LCSYTAALIQEKFVLSFGQQKKKRKKKKKCIYGLCVHLVGQTVGELALIVVINSAAPALSFLK
jgi:hypothetical protein